MLHGKATKWLLTGIDGEAPSLFSHPASRSKALAHTARGADVTAAMFWQLGVALRNRADPGAYYWWASAWRQRLDA